MIYYPLQVPTEKITILCCYKAQVTAVQRHLSGELRAVTVYTVDNFQGDEQDVIILSTVRNNDVLPYRSGFLRSRSRSCVACSRAKRGLFVLGHAGLLRSANEHWKAVVDDLLSEDDDEHRDGLSLLTRDNTIVFVQTPNDIEQLWHS